MFSQPVIEAEPIYAQLAPSEPCAICGEMTMATKMVKLSDGRTTSLHSLFGKKPEMMQAVNIAKFSCLSVFW